MLTLAHRDEDLTAYTEVLAELVSELG
jgi:hypothetical protein